MVRGGSRRVWAAGAPVSPGVAGRGWPLLTLGATAPTAHSHPHASCTHSAEACSRGCGWQPPERWGEEGCGHERQRRCELAEENPRAVGLRRTSDFQGLWASQRHPPRERRAACEVKKHPRARSAASGLPAPDGPGASSHEPAVTLLSRDADARRRGRDCVTPQGSQAAPRERSVPWAG